MNQDDLAVCLSQNPSQRTLSTISPSPDTRDSFQDAPSTSDEQPLISVQSRTLPRTEFHGSHTSNTISSAPSESQTGSPPVLDQGATPPDQSLNGVQMPASRDQEPSERITPTEGQTTTGSGSSPGTTKEEKEWRSWKVHWAYILAVLTFAVVMIVTLAALLAISHRKSGFARETNPPSFLVRHPRLRKAVWEQGILYTAFPAFIMTIYRTLWDSCVMAIADRQPYVDLNLKGGAHPRNTILLDYKAKPLPLRWVAAFQNGHYFLAACLLMSLIMLFTIVPLASFLFTMDAASLHSTFSLSFINSFDVMDLFSSPGDILSAIELSAGVHLQQSSLPPWTNGYLSFPSFATETNTGEGNVSVTVAAYGSNAQCVAIPRSRYNRTISRGPSTVTISITAQDRGCEITHDLNLRTDMWSPTIFLASWHTPGCSIESGYTRTSIIAASYNRASDRVQNVTLVSCRINYFKSQGLLTTRFISAFTSPLVIGFSQKPPNATEELRESIVLRRYLENTIHTFQCFDVVTPVDGNQLVKYIYRLSSKMNPAEPFHPDTMANTTRIMLETTYAIYAATSLFKPLSSPVNSTGTRVVSEKRLYVVGPVSYVVLCVLTITAFLNVGIFKYVQTESILKEEPYGLLNAAGILYKSTINGSMMERIVSHENGSAGRARTTGEEIWKWKKSKDARCYYHHGKGYIVCNNEELQPQGGRAGGS